MKVYFVRHGESESNKFNKYLGSAGSLTPEGVRQADIVAERFQLIDIDIILSSNMVRARETAEIISRLIKKKITFSNLLVEKKYPTELIGKVIDGPEAERFFEVSRTNAENSIWHFSDEENFWDLQKRAMATWQFIEQRPDENILVVTHGVFLRFIIFTLLLGDNFIPKLYFNSPGQFWTSNTGITLCEKVEGDNRWRLITWNDHAHLSELKT